MAHMHRTHGRRVEGLFIALTAMIALGLGACAATPPPNPSGPQSNEPPYPILMIESPQRREATLLAWSKFTTEHGVMNSAAPELNPVTATIRTLPALSGSLLYLPKVGDTPMTEENTRESLRRFIASASPWIGAQPQHLSLVQRVDAADGTKSAHYEQRPFRYPLRNGFGKLEIAFAPDRRILRINSTCIPEAEQLRSAAAGTRPKWDAVEVAKQIAGRTFTYSDALGNPQTLTLGQNEEVAVRELVIYPLPRLSDPSTLEFHLAWEITLKRPTGSLNIYLDAVSDELIHISPVS